MPCALHASNPSTSYGELAKLPPAARDVFQIKTVEHSDVYYASFIDKLFERLAEAGVADDGGAGDEPGTPADPSPTPYEPNTDAH